MHFRSLCGLLLVLVCCVGSSLCTFELNLDSSELSKGVSLQFVDLFSKCVRFTPRFDNCVKTAINNAKDFFTTGVPELHLPAMDPWTLADVRIAKPSYEMNLTDIKESSWQQSTINRFKSNLRDGGFVQITQYSPELFLQGRYRVLNRNPEAEGMQEGVWNFTLIDVHRTLAITRNKQQPEALRVKLSINEISDVQLHISDSKAEDYPEKDYLDNQLLNSFWIFGFPMVRPMVEELLSNAYSQKFSEVFGSFNWDQLFPLKAVNIR